MSRPRTIAIVGAGFSGTLVAANLLKSPHWSATRIVLIERAAQVARGKAYADREHRYLLNVPAGRMSADSRSPLDFLSYAQHRMPHATADDFLPRSLYGEYLEAKLLEAETCAPPHVEFERLQGEACGIEKADRASRSGGPAGTARVAGPSVRGGSAGGQSGFRIQLTDGRSLRADDVVLALGNPPPAPLPGADLRHLGEACYTADPWASPVTFRAGETILLVGTGLTMADIALAAAESTNQQIRIHSISRHGLVPPSQTQFSHEKCKGDSAGILRAASFSALTLLRSIRELVDETERGGGDWREAITFIRNMAPQLWQRLPAREKRRMIRHVRPYWDVHRHRLPNQTLAKLKELRQQRKLNIHAGRIESLQRVGETVQVTWKPRGQRKPQTMLVDRVINCTGPNYDIRRSPDPFVRSLVTQGLAVSDPLNLGIRTGAYGAVIDSRGRTANNLFYVGPMLRADHWEATAAQELRGHAERLASYLAAPVGRAQAAQLA